MNDVETDTVGQPAGEDLPTGRHPRRGGRARIGAALLSERVGAREREAA
jgi:hypothetical protein